MQKSTSSINFKSESRVNDPSVIEDQISRSRRAKKVSQKINDDTYGIDGVDERSDADRWEEAKDLMSDE